MGKDWESPYTVQVHFVSEGILRCWLSIALVVVASHVLLCLCQCSLGLCRCGVHPIHEFIDCFQAGHRLCRLKSHARMLTGVQVERCLLAGSYPAIPFDCGWAKS